MYFALILSVCFFTSSYAVDAGLRRAVDYIKQPIREPRGTNDIILRGIVTPWESSAYKLQVLRVRLGLCWEYIAEDYGFSITNPLDIINNRRKILAEIKNSRQISSTERRAKHRLLKTFKRNHPDYTAVFGFVNGGGGDIVKDGICYMYGDSFLNFIFGRNRLRIIRTLRSAVQTHFQ
jgi:hypothetical protein